MHILQLTVPLRYAQIQKHDPQDCVSQVNNIVDHFDDPVQQGNEEPTNAFKGIVGLESPHRQQRTSP